VAVTLGLSTHPAIPRGRPNGKFTAVSARFSAALSLYFTFLSFFSERELTFTFAICYRPSVCLSVVCRLSVTFVRPTQAIEIFGNISAALGTLYSQHSI